MSGLVRRLDHQIIQAMKDYLWRSVFMYQRSRPQEPPLVFPEECCYASTAWSGFLQWMLTQMVPPPPPPLIHLQQHSLCILTINNWLSFSLPCFTSASMFRHLSVGGTCMVKLILACSVFGLQNKSISGDVLYIFVFTAFILFLKLAPATPLYYLKH